jgi:hypothetical protein
MDILDEFPSDYFKGQEMAGKTLKLTIKSVEKEEMQDGRFKPVMHFKEDPRKLVLNVENRSVMVDRYGRDTRNWSGKSVTLITRRVSGPNGICWGIRFSDQPTNEYLNDDLPLEMTPAAEMAAQPKRSKGKGFAQ